LRVSGKIERAEPGFMTGIALLLPITLSTMAIVLLAPILPKLLDEFKSVPGHEYLVPVVLTVPALCVALLSLFAGMLGDRFGRRKLLMMSFVVYGIFGVAPIFLSDLWLILLTRIGVGIAEAAIMVLTTTMIGDYFKGERRDKWLAGQTAFASVSALLFFNLGGALGELGWRTPFWVYGSAFAMMALVIMFTWEPTPDAAFDATTKTAPTAGSWDGFPWKRILPIIAITVYASIFFYTVQIQASSGLALLGLDSPAQIGFLTSVASLGVPLGTFVYSRIRSTPVARLLLVEFGLLAVGFMLMAKSGSVTGFLTGCFINQLGAGMLLPTLLVWAMSFLDFEVRGRGTGMWQAAFALGQFLSAIIVTYISLRVGGLLASFAWLAGGAAIAAVVALAMTQRKRPALG
jgi:MFS family permease